MIDLAKRRRYQIRKSSQYESTLVISKAKNQGHNTHWKERIHQRAKMDVSRSSKLKRRVFKDVSRAIRAGRMTLSKYGRYRVDYGEKYEHRMILSRDYSFGRRKYVPITYIKNARK